MQTFLPLQNFSSTAACLDRARLGSQRKEVLQLLMALRAGHGAWTNHPAARMWIGHEYALAEYYGRAICDEWISRSYKDTCKPKILAFSTGSLDDVPRDKTGLKIINLIKNMGQFPKSSLPAWVFDSRVHSSHRARLLDKKFEHYSQFGWNEDPSKDYEYWPVPLKSNIKR